MLVRILNFLDIDDWFVISLTLSTREEEDTGLEESEAMWKVFSALCQKVSLVNGRCFNC
jgi:hypothetical protein